MDRIRPCSTNFEASLTLCVMCSFTITTGSLRLGYKEERIDRRREERKKLCTESSKHMIEPNKGRLSSSKTEDSIHRPLCPEPCLFSTVADETRHYVFLYT